MHLRRAANNLAGEEKNINSEEELTQEAETQTEEAFEEEAKVGAEDAAETEAEDKKGFFKKKDKKDKKDLQIEELTDKYRRTMAEFDNFRKGKSGYV